MDLAIGLQSKTSVIQTHMVDGIKVFISVEGYLRRCHSSPFFPRYIGRGVLGICLGGYTIIFQIFLCTRASELSIF